MMVSYHVRMCDAYPAAHYGDPRVNVVSAESCRIFYPLAPDAMPQRVPALNTW